MQLETNAVTIETDTFSFEELAHECWRCKVHAPAQLTEPIDDPMGWNIRTPSSSIERPPHHARS